MKALVFFKSIPRYLLLKLAGSRARRLAGRGFAPLRLEERAEPKRPGEAWVRVAPTLAGVCGSDLATICGKASPYLAPVTSLPFVMGHEVVGTVTEAGSGASDIAVGDRVVVQPALGCRVRGIEPPCASCRADRPALCSNVTRGDISAGIQTGYCRDTGGGFSGSLVAYRSQLYKIPPELPDKAAVLIEPFACALHGVLRAAPRAEDTVLVVGCGAIGLLTVAALWACGFEGRLIAVAKYAHQREHALRLGAGEVLPAQGAAAVRYARWAAALNAEVLDPQLGKPAVIGGADVVFDCVGSSATIDDGLRFTRSGGTFVLVGMPAVPRGVDWTAMWYKELTVHAAYAYGPEQTADGVRDTFDVAIDAMKQWAPKLVPLVGEPYALDDYRAAFAAALNAGRSRAIKTVFAPASSPGA